MVKRLISITIMITTYTAFLPKPVVAGSCTPVPPDTTCSVQDSVTITATVPDVTASFSGFAPASSTVTIKDNGATIGTTIANASGQFNRSVISTPGTHDFALFLTDTAGRTTPETLFDDVNLPSHGDTQVPSSPAPPNINLPPTIALSKTSIVSGESVSVFGQGAPGSTVHVIRNGSEVFNGIVGSGSSWQFTLSSGYVVGTNTVYAYLTRTGLPNSVNSFSQNLQVSSCKRSDLNCDGFVNLTDFSILMYWWETSHAPADINGDGVVGLIDFSIMMFDWTE